MANIAILNYCNLTCPYCFANEYIESEKQLITLEQLDRILDFLGKSNSGRVGIIGGEPTIHPHFSEIMERVKSYCISHDTRCSIFTNGIKLYDYARLLDERTGCLVNVNHPDIVGKSNWEDTIRSLDRINLCSSIGYINLGINLYPTMLESDYIFDLALKYKKDHIRVSYVAPTCQFENVVKDDYYQEAKSIFLSFAEKAKSYGIRLRLDCNHVPRCYFNEKELNFLDTIVEGFHDYCEPVVDITPDFQGTACFGAYKLYDLSRFESLQEVERYLRYKRLYPLSEANCSGKCGNCEKHKNLSCQGGCLAFANN